MTGAASAEAGGLLAWLASGGPATGAAITAAVGVLVGAAGWTANAWAARRDARRLRREGRYDLLSALGAEIEAHLMQLETEEALEAHKTAVLARMEAEPDFVPFVPRTPHDLMFASLVGKIEVLPTRVVEKVALHYDHVASVAAFRDDLRTPEYGRLAAERRAAMFEAWMEMKVEAFRRGRVALAVIDDALDALAAYRN